MECSYSLKNIDQPCISNKGNNRNKQDSNENPNRNQENQQSSTLSPKPVKRSSISETNAIESEGVNSQATASRRWKARVKRDAASKDNGKIFIVRRFVELGR